MNTQEEVQQEDALTTEQEAECERQSAQVFGDIATQLALFAELEQPSVRDKRRVSHK